jgi:YHS domain-containing protein
MPEGCRRFLETAAAPKHHTGMLKVILVFALLISSAPSVAAGEPVKAVNTDANGLALKGYDPVAYFAEGKAVKGSSALHYEWNGATWRFATFTNRERFMNDPEAYAPRFGGFCAWAVSRNYTADIDPEAFDIVDGKLYLNYSKFVQLRWKAFRDANIRKAEQNWPKLLQGTKGTK